MDLTKGFAGWQKKLQAYNDKFGPRPVSGGGVDEDAAAMRLFDMAQRQVSVYDVEKGERYTRQGIGVTTPGHSRALSKIFPKFDATGATEDETWDKNPSRLAVFSARLDEMYGAKGGVHPTIRGVMGELGAAGWDNSSLSMLAGAPMGSVEDDKDTIEMFNRIYQFLKPIGFNQGLLDTGKNLDATLWNDAIALLNILEEAGKSFESVQYFAKKTSKSPLTPTAVPGPGMPGSPLNPTSASPGTPQNGDWFVPSTHSLGIPDEGKAPKTKCKGVDLCQPTLNRFESWFASIRKFGGGTSTGGGTPTSTKGSTTGGSGGSGDIDYEKMFREKFLGEVEHPKGWRKYVERAPVVGLPFQMKRKEKEYGKRILQADTDTIDWASLAPKGYWKLLDKETHARNSYFRSLRGATTSWLIAAHVMRIFGQTSQVYHKAHESVMKGFGYIIDMFLMPIIPYLAPVVKGLVMIGNVIRQIPAMAIVGGILIGKLIWDTYQWFKALGRIPEVINKASAAIDKLTAALERIFPIPEEVSNPHLNEERGLVPYTEQADAYRGRMMNQSRMLPPGKTYETDFYAPETGPASGKSGKYDIIPGVNWTFGGPGVRPPEKKRPVPKGFLGDVAYYNKGGVVPGVGNKDSVLAMLTPGEVVISKNDLPHYADGGVVGGVIGNVLGLYGNIMSTDIAQSIVGGLGVVSKSVGAMMAPLAPTLAVGAMGGRGFNMVKNAIDRGTKITTMVSEGGFGALRTIASAQLVGLLTGLGPLLPIAAAVIGVYAWLNGYGVAIDGSLRGIRMLTDTVKGILKSFYDVGKKFFDAAKGFFDWLKEKLGLDEKKGVEEPKKGGIPDEKWKIIEEERRRRAREKFKGEEVKDEKWKIIEEERRRRAREKLKGEEVKDEGKGDEKKKSVWERITDKFPWLRGVPGMTLLGGAIGAAESKEPIDWAKSGVMGGAAQIAFNVGEAFLNKLKLPGGKIMGGLGGFLAPDFGEHIGKAFVSGEGPLGIGKYLGLQGNRTAERAVSMVATQLMTGTSIVGNIGAGISDAIGGTDLKGGILQQILSGNSKISGDYSAMGELYEFGYNNPKVAPMASMLPGGSIIRGGSQMATLVQIANDISKLVDNTKQPTINNNHIEMSNSDPYALFQQFVQWLGTTGNTQGLQRTI